MRLLAFILTLALAAQAHAATPTTLAANMIPIGSGQTLCQEPSCVVTAVWTNAVFQFGTGTGATWCQTITPTPPLSVNYATPNLALCAYDPDPGVIKQLDAQQQATPYTITYTIAGVVQPVFTVPALPAPPPPPTPNTMTFSLSLTYNGTPITATCTATPTVGP
jgi:hypothetical protein